MGDAEDNGKPIRFKGLESEEGSSSHEDGWFVVSIRDTVRCSEEELPLIDVFVRRIIEGKWKESLSILSEIGPLDEKKIISAKKLILEQNFYELWNEDKKKVEFLEIARIYHKLVETKGLRAVDDPGLSQMLIFLACAPSRLADRLEKNPELFFRKKFIDQLRKSKLESRLTLLDNLHQLIYPTVMIPHGNACRFHNSLVGMSPLVKHQCGRDTLQAQRLQILHEHGDKIWSLQFSHNGKYLASSSGDCVVIVWEVALDSHCVNLKHKLFGHQKPVSYISWSPVDDVQLLTCGADEVVRRWDVASGQCLHVYKKSGLGLVTCGWAPDGKSIFSGLCDNSISVWDTNGNELEWRRFKGQRTTGISELGIGSNEKQLVIAFADNMILLLGWESKSERFIEEDKKISSFSLSEDGKFLLVSLGNEELHLWDIDGSSKLVTTFRGRKSWRSDVRSCCGNAFVASGSDDSQVYVWDRLSGELVLTIAGHSGIVNCVCLNPKIPHMLASASDRTIHIWGLNQVKNPSHLMEIDESPQLENVLEQLETLNVNCCKCITDADMKTTSGY